MSTQIVGKPMNLMVGTIYVNRPSAVYKWRSEGELGKPKDYGDLARRISYRWWVGLRGSGGLELRL